MKTQERFSVYSSTSRLTMWHTQVSQEKKSVTGTEEKFLGLRNGSWSAKPFLTVGMPAMGGEQKQ